MTSHWLIICLVLGLSRIIIMHHVVEDSHCHILGIEVWFILVLVRVAWILAFVWLACLLELLSLVFTTLFHVVWELAPPLAFLGTSVLELLLLIVIQLTWGLSLILQHIENIYDILLLGLLLVIVGSEIRWLLVLLLLLLILRGFFLRTARAGNPLVLWWWCSLGLLWGHLVDHDEVVFVNVIVHIVVIGLGLNLLLGRIVERLTHGEWQELHHIRVMIVCLVHYLFTLCWWWICAFAFTSTIIFCFLKVWRSKVGVLLSLEILSCSFTLFFNFLRNLFWRVLYSEVVIIDCGMLIVMVLNFDLRPTLVKLVDILRPKESWVIWTRRSKDLIIGEKVMEVAIQSIFTHHRTHQLIQRLLLLYILRFLRGVGDLLMLLMLLRVVHILRWALVLFYLGELLRCLLLESRINWFVFGRLFII